MQSKRHKKLDAIEFSGHDLILKRIRYISFSDKMRPENMADEDFNYRIRLRPSYKVEIYYSVEYKDEAPVTYSEYLESRTEGLELYEELITIWKEYLDNKDK